MSLLMDALKKAEREREAQASKEQGKDPVEPQELSLDPIDRSVPTEGGSPPREEEPLWSLEEEEEPRSLDFQVEESDLLELDADAGPPATAVPSGMEDLHLSPSADDIPLEDTSSTMPSMKAVRASVDRYFDGSHSSSLSMSLPLETDEATTVVRQREEQAQAAARSVFDAKAKKRRYGMGWLAAVPIVLLLFGAGGYYYWTLLEQPSQWRSPGAALAPAQPAPAASAPASQPAAPPPAPTVAASEVAAPVTGPASEPTAAAGVEAAADTEDESLEPGLAAASGSDLEPALSEVLGVAPPPSGDLTPAVAEPVTEPVVEPVAVPPEPPPSTEELLASADEQIGAALGDLRVLEQGAIGTHGVSISKRPGPNQVEIGVRAGYQAFQRGDYVAAEVNYRGALQREPQNRDAMLGIAALAMIQQRWAAAAEIYRQLLRMNPRDDVAQTGLLSVEPNVDPSGSETRLKLMLEREPEAHYLYFSLGNLYASSSRWADAQGAFFDAFRLDSGNADYAYNLAVSLEHISKPGPALEYYRRALALAGQQAVRFSKDSVLQRIQVLSKASS